MELDEVIHTSRKKFRVARARAAAAVREYVAERQRRGLRFFQAENFRAARNAST
jgi:hypothetical protein